MKKSSSGNISGRVPVSGDPRMPEKAKVYVKKVAAPDDAPLDIAGILAMMFGLIGITMKVGTMNHHRRSTLVQLKTPVRASYRVCSELDWSVFCVASCTLTTLFGCSMF